MRVPKRRYDVNPQKDFDPYITQLKASQVQADLDKIDIYCGVEGQRIVGYINRSANLNQTPRIMGGADLKNWFQNQCRVNDRMRIEVLAPNSIKLTNT